MTDLILPPWLAALVQAGRIRAVPIDAERCRKCGGCTIGGAVWDGRWRWIDCDVCSGSGLVAPQPGQWTLRTNDEPLTWDNADEIEQAMPDGTELGFNGRWWSVIVTDGDLAALDVPASGQVVGPVTVTAVIPIVQFGERPATPAAPHMLRVADNLDYWDGDRWHQFSDHLLPGLDWTRPYAALIGDAP